MGLLGLLVNDTKVTPDLSPGSGSVNVLLVAKGTGNRAGSNKRT